MFKSDQGCIITRITSNGRVSNAPFFVLTTKNQSPARVQYFFRVGTKRSSEERASGFNVVLLNVQGL